MHLISSLDLFILIGLESVHALDQSGLDMACFTLLD